MFPNVMSAIVTPRAFVLVFGSKTPSRDWSSTWCVHLFSQYLPDYKSFFFVLFFWIKSTVSDSNSVHCLNQQISPHSVLAVLKNKWYSYTDQIRNSTWATLYQLFINISASHRTEKRGGGDGSVVVRVVASATSFTFFSFVLLWGRSFWRRSVLYGDWLLSSHIKR